MTGQFPSMLCQVCGQFNGSGIGPCLDGCPHSFEFRRATPEATLEPALPFSLNGHHMYEPVTASYAPQYMGLSRTTEK